MGGITLRPFLDLLPYRIDQALTGRNRRASRVRRLRIKAAKQMARDGSGRRRLYIDLAVISRNDAGTGIQRVVRALALALLEDASPQWDVRFVTAFRRSAYHIISWPEPGLTVEPGEIEARPGDVFLGLDFSLDAVRRHRRQLARFRRGGGSLWFLVYDLLPMQRPEWFSPNNVIRYKAWIEVIAGIADGFLCISHQTEQELRQALKQKFDLSGGYQSCVVPMGHDIMESVLDTEGESPDVPDRFDMSAPFTLMVGTLEPRKGHADIVAAFSELWQAGGSDHLVLVGRMGWRVEELRTRILTHPEFGRKLMWFGDVGDAELEHIYKACQGMIIASHAEGFGLPLIEALGHRKPVLARDLPIFRQHEALGVRYFPAEAKAKELAGCIRKWIEEANSGCITITPPERGWKDAAHVILSAID
jgi:glycosyltransferase involved in cell wall biosynthesis